MFPFRPNLDKTIKNRLQKCVFHLHYRISIGMLETDLMVVSNLIQKSLRANGGFFIAFMSSWLAFSVRISVKETIRVRNRMNRFKEYIIFFYI